MKFALLVLFTAATLPAVTIIDIPAGRILPGSYIDVVTEGESADYEFITEGGFSLGGSSWAPFQGFYLLGDALESHSGFAEELQVRTSYFFDITSEGAAYVTGEPVISAPFSVEGVFFDAPMEEPPYYQAEFFGSGTAYFTMFSYIGEYVDGQGVTFWEVESVRYEFEAAPIPEPATWGMLLLGLGAACWAGKKRR